MTQIKNKPIISIFIHCFPPARGGLEYLMGEIKKILDEKYEVHIITGQGLNLDSYKTFSNFTIDNSNNIHRFELNYLWQRIANKFLNKIIFKIGFFSPYYFGPILKYTPEVIDIIKKSDLIIGAGMPTKMFYDSFLFAKKYSKTLVLFPVYHNVSYYNHCPQFQHTLNYASVIIYQTQQEINGLTTNYKIDKNKLTQLAYNEYTQEQIKNIKLKKLNSKNITIGFVGQVTIRKNLTVFKDYLDKYLPYWKKQKIKLNILIAGTKTNSAPEIEKIFGKYLKNKNIKIIYDFTDAQKSDIYKKIDIFISPSHEESLGIVNFEAIFHGLPIIVHRLSAFEEFLDESDKFATIDELHQSILNHLHHPHSQISILKNYNQDIYRYSLLQLISSLIQVK